LAKYTERLLSAAGAGPAGEAISGAWLADHGWV
jgi:hypothetical protein